MTQVKYERIFTKHLGEKAYVIKLLNRKLQPNPLNNFLKKQTTTESTNTKKLGKECWRS